MDAAHPHETLVVKAAENSETEKYRIMTGFFNNLKSFNNARDQFKENYSNIIYESTDDSDLHEDGDLKLRFYTGQVIGISKVEALKKNLESEFPWNFHIVEALITST